MKGTADHVVLRKIYRKSTNDAFLHKSAAFLTKYFLNVIIRFKSETCLSKAFECLDHELLIAQLSACGYI